MNSQAGKAPRYLSLLLAFLLAMATFALYLPSLQNGFINYDDPAYVTKNLHVQQGITLESISWAFKATVEANWHPLTWISHMVDFQLFQLNPGGHHLTNLLLHILNVVLLFLLLRNATGHIWRSAFVAALFALHPLNVESVAWIAQRKSLLCTLSMFLAIWAYYRYVHRPNLLRYTAVAGFLTLALMAKPMVVTLPFVLLLLDYWPLARIPHPSWKTRREFVAVIARLTAEKVPLFLIAIASAVITVYAQRRGGAVGTLSALPLTLRLKNALYSYLSYILSGISPSRLAVFYPHPENSLVWWKVGVAVLFILGLTAIVWRARERRYLLTAWLWYLGTLIPVIGIVQVGRQASADRYVYVPFIGLFIMVVWITADWSARVRTARIPTIVVGVLVLSCYSYIAWRQIGYWKSSYTLFAHALDVTQGNGIAEEHLGLALCEQGHFDLAIPHFAAAVRLTPDLPTPHYNLGTLMLQRGRMDDAMREYKLALSYVSDPLEGAQIHNNLGVVLLETKQLPAAVDEFNAAIALDPNHQKSFIGRGNAEYEAGNFEAALSDFTHASRLEPSSMALFWMGRTFQEKGDVKSAVGAYEAALQIAPDMRAARNQLEVLGHKVQR
jgi:tetratricopeptide (TPR) repeat protein